MPGRKLADNVFHFEFAPDSSALTGQHRTLDTRVLLPVLLAADDGSKVAYIVAERRRAGMYLATGVP